MNKNSLRYPRGVRPLSGIGKVAVAPLTHLRLLFGWALAKAGLRMFDVGAKAETKARNKLRGKGL